MFDAIETFDHAGFTVEICPDESPESPRTSCDNMGKLWTMESRYNSPDALPVRGNVFESIAETLGGVATYESNCKALDAKAVWLPVWKYEHSGCAYAAAAENPFHCPWDSGQAGVIFVTLEDVRKEYGVKRVTKAIRAKALAVLQAEVKAYSAYAAGEYYGFRVLDSEGEEVDSCWGFDDLEYCKETAKESCK
ncbi:hypothetical protein vBRpoSV10_231 [Ruegeria phage vB_RpoS-V10]|nr:hypothetical protein vBRpoSV10_231 [Ruegeria phage vB_RpoS-V10]